VAEKRKSRLPERGFHPSPKKSGKTLLKKRESKRGAAYEEGVLCVFPLAQGRGTRKFIGRRNLNSSPTTPAFPKKPASDGRKTGGGKDACKWEKGGKGSCQAISRSLDLSVGQVRHKSKVGLFTGTGTMKGQRKKEHHKSWKENRPKATLLFTLRAKTAREVRRERKKHGRAQGNQGEKNRVCWELPDLAPSRAIKPKASKWLVLRKGKGKETRTQKRKSNRLRQALTVVTSANEVRGGKRRENTQAGKPKKKRRAKKDTIDSEASEEKKTWSGKRTQRSRYGGTTRQGKRDFWKRRTGEKQ